MAKKDPLLDVEFLKKLDNQIEHEVYAKIISLDLQENPLEEITGRCTGGSVNVDGSSAIRRSCSLTMVAEDVNINDFYWGLSTKFKLFIGLRNYSDPQYEDIIWFKQGIFLITSFSTSLGVSDYSISISGKDKMCLLNGDIGGNLTALTTDFGKYDQIDMNGNVVRTSYPIQDIITEAVHHYAGEPYHNIIVEDLEEGLELMEYRGDKTLYMLIESDTLDVNNIFFEDNIPEGIKDELNENFVFDSRITQFERMEEQSIPSTVTFGEKECTIAEIKYGDTCGFKVTELIYPDDLIGDVDNSITSAVLDKLVEMLGDFEYFYDVDGRFHFRRKKIYYNRSWNTIKGDRGEEWSENAAYNSATSYSFVDSNLVSSFQNSPAYENVKNDFSIWGVKKLSSDSEMPFHLRYAIDEKPTYYKAYNGKVYKSDECDWRELIYQMADDYFKHQHDDDFLVTVAQNNPEYYSTGITGYEQYYTDMQGFWRYLYNPDGSEKLDLTDQSNLEPGTTYYIWNEDSNTFDSHSFRDSTSIVPIDPKKEYYAASASYTLQEIIKEIELCQEDINDYTKEREDVLYNQAAKIISLGKELNELNEGTKEKKTAYERVEQEYNKTIEFHNIAISNYNTAEAAYNYNKTFIDSDSEDLKNLEDNLLIAEMDLEIAEKNLKNAKTVFDNAEKLYNNHQTKIYNAKLNLAIARQDSDNLDEMYNQIIDDAKADLESLVKYPTYKPEDFLNLLDENGNIVGEQEKIDKMISTVHPNYEKVSDNKWKEYTQYSNYEEGTDYYKYQSAVDLSQLNIEKRYYTLDEKSNYVEVARTNVETGEYQLDDNSNLKPVTRSTPILPLGKEIYVFKGFTRTNTFSTDISDYYQHYKFAPATENKSGITYYKKVQTFEDDIHLLEPSEYTQEESYIILEDSLIEPTGVIAGFVKTVSLVPDKKYFSQTTIDGKTLTQQQKNLYRGVTYYTDETSQEGENLFDNKALYYVYNGFTSVVNLTELSEGYYTEKDSGVVEFTATLLAGKNYYQYIEVEKDKIENGSYYIIPPLFEKVNVLKEFVRGKTYYTKEAVAYEEVSKYDDYDSETEYYIYENKEYISLKDLLPEEKRAPLTDEEMKYYLKQYGVNLNSDTSIDALSQQFTFYIKKENSYQPVDYYEFDFYDEDASGEYVKDGADYRLATDEDKADSRKFYKKLDLQRISVYPTPDYNPDTHWTTLLDTPEDLVFWFDFMNADDRELAQYSVKAIGDRPKSVNDDSVKAIYYRDTPTVIFTDKQGIYLKTFVNQTIFNENKNDLYEKTKAGNYILASKYSTNKDYYRRLTAKEKQPGYTYINLPDTIESLFTMSAQGKSAYDVLDEFIYDYAYCTQSITLNTIPIYYLEPNTRILAYDEKSNINGEYIISSMSIPLTYNGTMSISATRAIDRIY